MKNKMTTKEKILKVSAKLFAEKGFYGTSIRDIAKQAKVNVAAINYHFGSKKNLYLEVIQEIFLSHAEKIRKEFIFNIKNSPKNDPECVISVLSKAVLLSKLPEDERKVVFSLLVRELTDPSEAFPVIAKHALLPLVENVAKELNKFIKTQKENLVLTVLSIISQIIFFNFFSRWVKDAVNFPEYDEKTKEKIIQHIIKFSLKGLEGCKEDT